ncbi:MAG: hypothetical protein LBO65_01305 [Spirochaetaceae bacterium]|jgi:hypothetical protein|nr:hypothetical protein [Spirochaetaceae bacterium]
MDGIKQRAMRRLTIRAILAVLWIGLGALIFVFNRGHTLLVDNRDPENPRHRAPDRIEVSVDSNRPLEFFRGDRDRFTVTGSKHRITIRFSDGTPDFTGTFILPIRDDMYILSIPKMINGIEPFVEVFHTVPESRNPEDDEIPAEEDELTAEETGADIL